MNKSTRWLVLYVVFLGIITVGVYIGIHIAFNEPFADPIFSSIKPLQTSLQEAAEKTPHVTSSISPLRPTLPPFKTTEKNKFFVKRFDDNPQNPIYIVRVYVIGSMVETDKTIQGSCILISDPLQTRHQFIIRGNDGKYTVGIHKGGFMDYPNELESYSFRDLKNSITPRTPVQLTMTTKNYSLEERANLIALLEDVKEATPSGQKPVFRAFSIGLVK